MLQDVGFCKLLVYEEILLFLGTLTLGGGDVPVLRVPWLG
jgi:hypothetical protein